MIRSVAFGVTLLMATSAMAQSVAEKTGINAVAGITPTTQAL